ncbi:histidine kinase dimerization/phospho-acceptor domain-containing protein [Novosphingobium sp.]|uniref:sensor histidine kinase n=1 Tax=Novosphingobium sp. TaxID=1874826 RepID=UPI002736887D|nr:histidine kinase dimerization/phospho-acceptor domain-containing protein [Novosphingobium sp.]MDP3906852.1 histidine kinase dimerization/phospho-acceptor domain-containing protein [Novosphingobium sp.]
MHFDDRLATVLRSRADGPATSRIQFRQLLDLLGTLPADAAGPQIDAAYARLAEQTRAIPDADRAAIVREAGLRLRSPRLVAALAQADPAQAASALARAHLAEEQWLDLIPALPIAARGHVRQRRDLGPRVEELLARLGIRERGLPPATAPTAPAADPATIAEPVTNTGPPAAAAPAPVIAILPPEPAPGPVNEPLKGIGALVRKIEAYRLAKQVIDVPPHADSPRLPLGEDGSMTPPAEVQAFDFSTDAAGRIVWTDPGVAPMTVGLQLGGRGPVSSGADLNLAMRSLQPLRALLLRIDGAPAIAGQWQVDAVPAFDPLSGRFGGYRGRMRRPATLPASAFAPARDTEAERLRQALHELRTPVNAIQGFAEVIQQQLFGPTPHEYRALAAGIAGDAARMLAAFEELERLARLDSKVLELEAGETRLDEIVAATVAQLGAHTRSRGSGFEARQDDGELILPLARIEVERIVWRLLATLAGTAAPGEQLKLRLRRKGSNIRLSVGLPAVLAAKNDAALFAAATGSVPQVIAAGVFGVGFALRLVKAEAHAAGGTLDRHKDRLRLELPGLTPAAARHSHSAAGQTNI